jgi:carbonic anhydrase
MTITTDVSRRQFMWVSGLAIAGTVLAPSFTGGTNAFAAGGDPDAVLVRLADGNKRFMSGHMMHPHQKPADFLALEKGQSPVAIIVTCADSRVAPELIFDQGLGDLFVVRVAGNVIAGTGAELSGSIEYGVEELGVPLIMVLGHSNCGAVTAAVNHFKSHEPLPGSVGGLVELIEPTVVAVKDKPGDLLANAIKENVERGVAQLKNIDPVLVGPVKNGTVKVVGGVYDLHSGKVTVFS